MAGAEVIEAGFVVEFTPGEAAILQDAGLHDLAGAERVIAVASSNGAGGDIGGGDDGPLTVGMELVGGACAGGWVGAVGFERDRFVDVSAMEPARGELTIGEVKQAIMGRCVIDATDVVDEGLRATSDGFAMRRPKTS
ncbi:MAG: hypothetical protein ABJD13_15820 [Paracoccaceae bacterium]